MTDTPPLRADTATALRWQLAGADHSDQLALFGVEELTAAKSGTGRMSSLEFLHVTTRRILNRIPEQSRLPFRWTINVYRGCSHACTYCLAGDTPIIMADGTLKPIADVRAGDHVYGTVRSGTDINYVPTDVLAHWPSTKPAHQVDLADGTNLVTSAEHRLLTTRGWKHVASGGDRLSAGDVLVGVGQAGSPPRRTADYRRGYVTGMIRTRRQLPVRQRIYVLAAHAEPLSRVRRYLADLGVPVREQRLTTATMALHSPSAASHAVISSLTEWPDQPSLEWRKGLLAALIDMSGTGPELRVTAAPHVLSWASSSLDVLGFSYQADGPRALRLGRDANERRLLRLATAPARGDAAQLDGVPATSDERLRVTEVVPLGIDVPMYDISTGTGDFLAHGVVSHNCFARPTHEYLGLNIGEDFERRIVVKINAVDRLRAELADPQWLGEPIAMGTNTDPYQRAEAKYRLTRGVLTVLAEHANPFSLLTKSALVTRDLDLLTAANARTDVSVTFSIGTLDERVWRATEPGTPHPRRRIDAMRRLAAAGVRTGALLAPILPGLSDHPDQLRAVVRAVRDAGGTVSGPLPLHLRPGVREHFLGWLAGFDPGLHADYVRRYATGAYAPARYTDRLREIIIEEQSHCES
jgi:DNA repair photolyase